MPGDAHPDFMDIGSVNNQARKMDSTTYDFYEEYEYLEEAIFNQDRKFRRRALRQGRPRQEPAQARALLTDFDDSENEFVPSYAAALDPLHHERQWLIESIGSFYRDNLISDVTPIVKGGKEANVYCCLANPATGMELFAAKLYRPRMLRHLTNDAIYNAGRYLRNEEGKQIKGRRYWLAMRKKTPFGKRLDIAWWIGNEFLTQSKLYEAGADVPKPVAHRGNTVLMEFIGDSQLTAPTLSEVKIEKEEARPLFERVMKNVGIMLENHLIHGDLSAYNILYWQGKITIIDFPQMIGARTNPHAYEILARDVKRVCDYFNKYSIGADPGKLTRDLWEPYMGRSF
jgi:RIO kinase 1